MAQDHNQASFRRGVMSLVILALLKREDMYGYQLVQECERSSGGALVTQEGSLYPVLYKLLDAGMISDYRVKSGKSVWVHPQCGNHDQSKMNVARRTCGYIGTQYWNQGRTQEIQDRVLHL